MKQFKSLGADRVIDAHSLDFSETRARKAGIFKAARVPLSYIFPEDFSCKLKHFHFPNALRCRRARNTNTDPLSDLEGERPYTDGTRSLSANFLLFSAKLYYL